MWGMETDWQRLADKVRGEETGSRGMGVILCIRRLGGHFAGLMAALLLPPRASDYF